MAYFSNAKKGDKVIGLVFGPGKITRVFNDHNYYTLEVEFKNGYSVMYTPEGVPNWGNFDEQTLFYKKDIENMPEVDVEANTKILSIKKIIKLRDKGDLEVKTPSGVWHNIKKVEPDYVEELLEDGLFFLFRKAKNKEN